MAFDVVVQGATYFDGTGAPGLVRDLGIRDGKLVEVSATPLVGEEVIEAKGCWVMPGFIDVHTHYDAELLLAPGLTESVRHGVTTVMVGSCSLSTVYCDPVDLADMFSRVEALPRAHVLAALEQRKQWSTPAEYVQAIERLPLGPNIASFLGHSDLRAHVMGLDRSTDPTCRPSADELAAIERGLVDAIDAGFLGLSTMTNPWDKLDGDRYRSRSLPSAYARWSEFRRLNRILRRTGRMLQSIPNLNTKWDLFLFLAASTGLLRRSLKVSLLAATDPKATRFIHRVFGPLAWLTNKLGGGDFRWQHLPTEFLVYADGIDLVVFEEFGSGRAALHLRDELERNALLADEAYRRWFRRDFEKKFTSRVWHRDFHDVEITACPDATLVGRRIDELALERGIHVVDAFLDLVVIHGKALRWRTSIAGDRPNVLDKLAGAYGITIGFSDAGAHLRNMAFYNFAIRLLSRVHTAAQHGTPFLTVEHAIHKLTGELGDFYNIAAGHLRIGDRADLTVIDPTGLADDPFAYNEAPMAEFGGLSRMVNRNDRAVTATMVNGVIAYREGAFRAGGHGTFLRAGRS